MLTNIRDPNIAAGFQALAQAFVPDPQALIAADLARYERDGLIADTDRTRADTARIGVDATRLAADRDRTQQYAAADREMAAILSDPAFDPADPAWRARLAGAAATTENGLQYGPGALTGFSSYVDPNFAGSQDAFSNILMGTGVTPDYANTPSGFNTSEANDRAQATEGFANDRVIAGQNNAGAFDRLRFSEDVTTQRNDADNLSAQEIARLNNDAELARLQYSTTTPRAPGAGAGAGTVTPPTVTPATVGQLEELLSSGITAQFGDDAVVDPTLRAALVSEAAALYQQTRNADAAIAAVLGGLQATENDGGYFGAAYPEVGRGVPVSPPAPAPTPPAAPPARTPPPPASAAPPGHALPGQTILMPDGTRLYLDPTTLRYVPLGPRREATP